MIDIKNIENFAKKQVNSKEKEEQIKKVLNYMEKEDKVLAEIFENFVTNTRTLEKDLLKMEKETEIEYLSFYYKPQLKIQDSNFNTSLTNSENVNSFKKYHSSMRKEKLIELIIEIINKDTYFLNRNNELINFKNSIKYDKKEDIKEIVKEIKKYFEEKYFSNLLENLITINKYLSKDRWIEYDTNKKFKMKNKFYETFLVESDEFWFYVKKNAFYFFSRIDALLRFLDIENDFNEKYNVKNFELKSDIVNEGIHTKEYDVKFYKNGNIDINLKNKETVNKINNFIENDKESLKKYAEKIKAQKLRG